MSLDRNGQNCRHHLISFDPDTNEYYCEECGDVVDPPSDDDE